MKRETAAKIERTDKSMTITHKDGTVTHAKVAPPGYLEAVLEAQKRDAEEREELKKERLDKLVLEHLERKHGLRPKKKSEVGEHLERNFPGFWDARSDEEQRAWREQQQEKKCLGVRTK